MRIASSFRDPSGFVYTRHGVLLRQVNAVYRRHYDLLCSSGLRHKLVARGLLIEHEEIDPATWRATADAYRVLRPEPVDFISYPYEWSFSQLKDAALCTLEIQKAALDAGLTLKDASAFNVQFHRGRPLLIDTLSFEEYEPGKPWQAYRQFCQHFLAPLALAAYRDARLLVLLKDFIDGIPLGLAVGLLPARTRWRPGLGMHLHLHARTQSRFESSTEGASAVRRLKPSGLRAILESLEKTTRGLIWDPPGTAWSDYYDHSNYTKSGQASKRALVGSFLDQAQPRTVWDLGANTGVFSRLASERGARVIAFDNDTAAVEANYRATRAAGETSILPLVLDLTVPTPAIGWRNAERDSWLDRGPVDLVLALALIHHLAISNNVPLDEIADLFSGLCDWLVIEFVPKEDSQVQRLLATREDVFPDYDRQGFQSALGRRFSTVGEKAIDGSERTLFLMRRREE